MDSAPKVSELHNISFTMGLQEYIGRFDVSMKNVKRVDVADGIRDLEHHGEAEGFRYPGGIF